MASQRPRRVLEEIESHIRFKRPIDLALSLLFLLLYALFLAVYFVNSPAPTVGGLSVTYFYSLVIWALIIILVFVAAKVCWR